MSTKENVAEVGAGSAMANAAAKKSRGLYT